MRIHVLAFAGCLLLSGLPARAQEPTLVVENARMIVGEGTVIESGSLVIHGDRILETTREPVVAPSARRIDAAGRTVLPGLIDSHVHLLMENLFEQPRSDSAMERFIVERLPARLRAYLEAGITTVMSAGDYWPFIREVREDIDAGEIPGPRVFLAGPLITAPEGHPAATFCGFLDAGGPNPWCREHLTAEVASASEARDLVGELSRQGVDHIKLVYEESPTTAPLRRELVAAVIDAAHGTGLAAYAHIEEPRKALAAIQMGLDGLVHVPATAPADTSTLRQLIEAMRSSGVSASTTLVIFDSFRAMAAEAGDAEVARQMAESLDGMRRTLIGLRESVRGSGLIALGTDAPHLPPGEAYHREIALLADLGFTPSRILEAATSHAAGHMGIGDAVGTLRPGAMADFIVVDGNPLEDLSTLRNVVLVVKGGRVVAGARATKGLNEKSRR